MASAATEGAIARPFRSELAVAARPALVTVASRVAPLYAIALAIVLGDALGNFRIFAPPWFAAGLIAAAAVAFLASRPALATLAALFAIIACSTLPVRAILEPARTASSIRQFADGSMVSVEGVVAREPERLLDRTHLYVHVMRAAAAGDVFRPVSGAVRISTVERAGWLVGDELRLTAKIRFPRNDGNPGEFDYQAFMSREGIDATMTAPENSFGTPAFELVGYQSRFPASNLEAIRWRIAEFIDQVLPPTESAEMRALVIGDRGGISEDLRATFARTGMAHLLVISGLHLSFVAGVMFGLVRLAMMLLPGLASRGYANKASALAAAIAVCTYATIAGHHVSTGRALVMVLTYMFAVMIDRSREAVASLALAAIVICLTMPGSTADVGFQLSFASVLAIVLGMRRYAAWYDRMARRDVLSGGLGWRWSGLYELALGYIAVSYWAMLGTAPLTAYHFNQVAAVGLIANAVVVPIMGLGATVLGLGACLLSFVWLAPAAAILRVAGALLGASNRLAAGFVDLPFAWSHSFTPTLLELAIAYAMLLTWLTAPIRGVPDSARLPAITNRMRAACVIVLTLAALADSAWWIRDRFYHSNLRVTFLSVGEGDSAVIRFPGSRVMLIDGGGAFRGYDYGERVVAPYLWSRKIMHVDYLALSHPDEDHFGGLGYVAQNLGPSEFWTVSAPSTDRSYADFLSVLMKTSIRVRLVDASTPSSTIGGVRLTPLGPEPAGAPTRNNSSMVLQIALGRVRFLFTGDIEGPAENDLLARGVDLRASVLKVPHHGSASSSSPGFVEAVRPEIAVISDGYLNRFHFPAPEVLNRYSDGGARVFRTDLDGAVIVETDGSALDFESIRGTVPRP